MMLKKRIDELEKKTGSKEPIWIIVQHEGAEPTEAQKEAAKAEYKAKYPDWQEKDTIVLYFKDGQFFAILPRSWVTQDHLAGGTK